VKAPADGRPINLYPLGDIHLGAAACDIEDFRRTVQTIAADPNAIWLGMGDYGDLIMPSDPRWAFSGHDWKNLGFANGKPGISNLGVEHRDLIERELAPIKDKCIGLLYGNHEHAFSRYYFIDIARYLADKFKVPMLGYTALVRLEVEISRGPKAHHETWPLTIFAEHGATGGGTDGNAINSLQKRAVEFEAARLPERPRTQVRHQPAHRIVLGSEGTPHPRPHLHADGELPQGLQRVRGDLWRTQGLSA